MNDEQRSETIVYLIHHGQTKLNAAGRLRGRTDAELDATGLAQADALARVIASPLRRTCQAATSVAVAAGVPMETDDGFNDRDYGDWTGEPKKDVEARFGAVGDAPGVETWQALTERVYAAFLQVTERRGRQRAGDHRPRRGQHGLVTTPGPDCRQWPGPGGPEYRLLEQSRRLCGALAAACLQRAARR